MTFFLYFLWMYSALARISFNENDPKGATCPIPLRYNVSCPVLCTSDIALCPLAMQPDKCQPNSFYCPDGQCHSGISQQVACANVTSTCMCPFGLDSSATQTKQLFPCKRNLRVNVPNYAQNEYMGDAPLYTTCQQVLSLNSTQSSTFFLKCNGKPPYKLSLLETEFQVFYVIIFTEILLLISYEIYRRLNKKRFLLENPTKPVFKQQSSKFLVVTEQDGQSAAEGQTGGFRMRGYKKDFFGTIAKASIIFMSFIWLLILSILIFDYYGLFSSLNYKDRPMLLVDTPTLSKAFILFWHITTIWFVVLQINSTHLLSYFYMRAKFDEADFVLVEKQLDVPSVLKGMSKFIQTLLSLEVYFRSARLDIATTLVPIEKTSIGNRYIEFECVRYVYDSKSEQFKEFDMSMNLTQMQIKQQVKGLTSSESLKRLELCGPNQISFQADTFWTGLKKEFNGIFYVYQLMQIIIWYYYAYYYMALVVNIVILISGITKVVVSQRSQKQVLEMATFHGNYKVLRDGQWKLVDSNQLVPGDIIEITASSSPLSVDCALVSGNAVMDEASLTGEALPIAKFPLKAENEPFTTESCHHHILYSGCKVLEVKANDENTPVQAYVLATGATTAKGTLVRDILYPTPFRFVFTEHLKIVILMLIVWGIVLLAFSISMLESDSVDSWFYGMTSISQVLSPLLPAVLVIGQSIATERLRKRGIICSDLNRITLAGKVKFFCFDKTGTLTKEGLEFIGTQQMNEKDSLDDIRHHFGAFGDNIKRTMLTCHTVTTVQDRFVGNFVDVEMFRVTGASLTFEGYYANVKAPVSDIPNLEIIKSFNFSHSHAYMSVIVRDTKTGQLSIYLKGSAERIKDIVNPASLPKDYIEQVQSHSSKGYYVIAMAYCTLPLNTSADVAAQWPREFLEKDCAFLGFMLFRNEVKADTASALADLRNGGCRVVMVTGDNINTAIYIGRESGMLRKDWQKQDPLVVIGDTNDQQEVVWKSCDDGSELSTSLIETLIQRSHKGFRPIEIAINGKAFNCLIKSGWLRRNLLEVRIFASMKPMDKIQCIRLHMEKGITGMCGDGGNDAGALKAAHTGIALSQTESSVVGHFSSSNRSIHCCVDLLREARCSLDVSFSAYKYLMMYGEILAFVGMVQYFFKINISQAMYILIDGSIVPLSWALTLAKPSFKLASSRPTAKLLGPETVFSIVGQITIDLIFMAIAIALLLSQPFYKCHAFDYTMVDLSRWWELADNYEATITSLMLISQIFHAAAALNLGWRYRQGSIKNWKFSLIYTGLATLLVILTVSDPNAFTCLFRINCGTKEALESLGYIAPFNVPAEYYSAFGHNVIPLYFRYQMLLLMCANLIVLLIWESLVIQGYVREWFKKRFGHKRLDFRH